MNVLIVTDKHGSAIDILAHYVKDCLTHFNIEVYPVHPKRNDVETMYHAQKMIKWADVIDIHYWKSGEVLFHAFPNEMADKPKLLCHFNPYDLGQKPWNESYDEVVVGNEEMYRALPYAHLIPYGIDLGFFRFNDDYTKEKVVNMTVARIEGKKGVREVAQACDELGYKLELRGRVSEPSYMDQIMKFKSVDYLMGLNEDVRQSYYRSAIHVCNSKDGFESGTLPILEAMACGVPVLTRRVGHVPELDNGQNMVVMNCDQEDVECIKQNLKDLMENEAQRLKIRQKAWETVKNRDHKRMADQFSKLYYRLGYKNKEVVSVIIPTRDRPKSLVSVLAAVAKQTYKQIEVVVVDSGDVACLPLVRKLRLSINMPVKYVHFDNKGEYTLPKARNMGIIAAAGDFIVFCDDRLAMDPDSVENFVARKKQRTWLWGTKEGFSKAFVENFSAIHRRDLISMGMFNERIDGYGGATEEVRRRFEQNGIAFEHVKTANAREVMSSRGKSSKRADIIRSKYNVWRLYGFKS